ncbi:MarR family winged helix-turn-helix transcriptional regulator [Streptosporangium sp. NPDC003464]
MLAQQPQQTEMVRPARSPLLRVLSAYAAAADPVPAATTVLELLSPAPLGQLALAQAVGVTPSVVVDVLDKLEAVGALRRVRDSADRRRQVVEITDDGRALVLSATRLAEQVDAELLDALDPAQATALRKILVRVATAQDLPVTQAAPGGGRTAAPSG